MTGPAFPSGRFCLIRHGETTANAAGLIAGRMDVALSERGRRQAGALARRAWPAPITLFSSPLARAQDTCRLGFPGRPFTLHDGLRERDWGVFEGRPLAEQPDREGTPEAGESWPGMVQRAGRAIIGICAASGPALPVLVCHSGIIRAVRVLWGDGSAGERPPNAVPLLFERSGPRFEEREL